MDEGSRIWIGYSYDFGRWILLDVAYIRLEDGDVRDEKNTISYRKTYKRRKNVRNPKFHCLEEIGMKYSSAFFSNKQEVINWVYKFKLA